MKIKSLSGAYPEVYGVPIGILDTDPEVKAQSHLFVDSKAPWSQITDDLPQHAEYD